MNQSNLLPKINEKQSIVSETIHSILNGLDWKIYYTFCLFYFTVITNIRDFPIKNVPLIYLAYITLIGFFGVKRIWNGFKQTFQLTAIMSSYWLYLIFLRITNSTFVINLVYIAQILEPIMIFSASGMAVKTSKGTKSAFGALITVLMLSTMAGNWIYFIGEPVKSWRETMQSSIGGNLVSGEVMRKNDKKQYESEVPKRNAGLSVFSFHFSYQLALIATILLLLILSKKHRFDSLSVILFIALFMVVIGIITNAERASLLSISIGIISYFIVAKKKIPYGSILLLTGLAILMIMILKQHSENWNGQSIFKRGLNSGNESISLRMTVIPLAAVSTILESPMGAGDLSRAKTFNAVARKFGWLSKSGEVQAVHHHFAYVILNTGIFGLLLVVYLFLLFWKNIKWATKTHKENNGPELILAASCLALLVHSFMHNAGFFEGDPGILAAASLLIGSNYNVRRRIKRKKLESTFGICPNVGKGWTAI